jgi:hypothetical protein
MSCSPNSSVDRIKKHHRIPKYWKYCHFYIDKNGYKKPINHLSRRCHTGYHSSSHTGPLGHHKASNFAGVLFSNKAAGWLHLNESLKHRSGCKKSKKIRQRGKIKPCWTYQTLTPASSTVSKTVVPAMSSFEDILEIRKTMAYYDPRNFKRSKKFRRNCCTISL